ncbi:MAG: hypothetical protein ACRC2S_10550 [Waterburya sp.]
MLIDDLSESMFLWLPSHMVEDSEAVTDVTKANGLILDFCDQEICLEQVLDEFSTIGVCMDTYLDNLDSTMRRLGA